jgi:hypothetical protein
MREREGGDGNESLETLQVTRKEGNDGSTEVDMAGDESMTMKPSRKVLRGGQVGVWDGTGPYHISISFPVQGKRYILQR